MATTLRCAALVLGALLALGLSRPTTAQVSFAPKTDFTTGAEPVAVAVADLNADGHADLVVANYDASTVSVLLGTGTGSFGPKTDWQTGTLPVALAVADLNGDGRLDLVVTNDTDNTASIFPGIAPPSAELGVTMANPVVVGVSVTYTVTVANHGPNPDSGVTLLDVLPTGVTLVSATPSLGTCSGATTLTCGLGALASGQSAIVTIVGTVTAAGPLTNTATVSGNVADPVPGNNTAIHTLNALTTLTVSAAGSGSGSVTSNPAGIACGSTCSAAYASDILVTITPAPAPGSTFLGWSGDADCSDGAVTMSGARTCIAVFQLGGRIGLYGTADLAGTWRYYDLRDSDPNALTWTRGTLILDATGTVGGGTFAESDGPSGILTGGRITTDETGTVHGSYTRADGATVIVTQAKINRGATAWAGVGTSATGVRHLTVAVQTAGAFRPADLAGTWHYRDLGDGTPNAPTWTRVTLTVDANGTVTGGSYLQSSGSQGSVTGGALTISAAGLVAGTVTGSSGWTLTLTEAQLDAGKSVLASAGAGATGLRTLGIAVRGGGAVEPATLAGTWRYFGYRDGDPNVPGWSRMTLALDAAGTLTGGRFSLSDGIAGTLTGGTVTLDAAGTVTGTVTRSDGGTEQIAGAVMDLTRTAWVGTGTDGAGHQALGIAVKVEFPAERPRAVGVYRTGLWYLDAVPNGLWDGCGMDGCVEWGGDPNDIPVVGDWNGSGTTKIGVYRKGKWYLDKDGDGVFNCSVDVCVEWGGDPNDIPVLGDWNGSGTTKIGVYRAGTWYLDTNGNGAWDECGTDACIGWGGDPTDQPMIGKW